MKRLVLALLAFLAGPALVALIGAAVLLLQYGDALFNVPGRAIVSLGRSVGLFPLRDCSTRSKPQVCDLMNAIGDAIVQGEAGVLFWLGLASLVSGYWAWRVWRGGMAQPVNPTSRTSLH